MKEDDARDAELEEQRQKEAEVEEETAANTAQASEESKHAILPHMREGERVGILKKLYGLRSGVR